MPGPVRRKVDPTVAGQRPSLSKAPQGQIQRATIEDCEDTHEEEVERAVTDSGPAVRRTINKIMGDPTPPELLTYFGQSAPDYAAKIGLRLAIIASKLPKATIECENPGSLMYDHFCDGTIAYVRAAPAFLGFGAIHVCQPQFHNREDHHRLGTLIHEGAHRYNNADDEGYYTRDCAETDETRDLSDADRRDNADSYGCLVQTLG